MKFRSVFLFAFLMFFSTLSSAGQVEMAQWIPWNFLSAEIQKTPLRWSAARSDWTLNLQGFTPKASQFQMQFQGALSEMAFHSQGAETRASALSAHLEIGALSIDQTLVKVIGGHQIRIRIQAHCQPFSIHISNFSLAAQAQFARTSSTWMPVLSSLQIQIPENSWRLSPIQCEGLQGLDSQILSQIQTALQNPENFQDTLKAWIAPQLNDLWKKSWEALSQKNWQNFQVDALGEPTDKGFFVLGHQEISSPRVIQLPLQMPTPDSAHPRLFLTKEGFEVLAQESLSQIHVSKINLQTIPEFSKLMRSRFLQFFVWPDLLNFSRKTPVWISTLKAGESLKLKSQSTGRWQMQLQTSGLVEIPRSGEVRNYLHWGLGLSSTLVTEVRDSQLTLTTQKTQSNFNWKFDEDYVQKYQPNTRISSKALQKAVQGLFENRQVQIQLPILNWGSRSLKLNRWSESPSMISMDWE